MNLQPGLYIKYGNSLKTITMADVWGNASTTSMAPNDVETLAAKVGWVFTALSKRRNRIAEIPYSWSGQARPPRAFTRLHFPDMAARIDTALQLHGIAYYLKLRNIYRNVIALRWLDPLTITPDYQSAIVPYGVTRYKRSNGVEYNAEDLLVFKLPGMRELKPAIAASAATSLAAQILFGINSTTDNIFDNNAIPPIILYVPHTTSDVEKNRLRRFFDRILNPRLKGGRGHRIIPVSKDISFQALQIDFNKLGLANLERSQIDVILAAHDVPPSEIFANAANYASSVNDTRRFVTTMGNRMSMIASVINQQPDWDATLQIQTGKHWALRRDEIDAAGAFVNYLHGFTPQAAAYLLGITAQDFPTGMQVFQHSPSKSVDAEKWQRKALRTLAATGSADCPFSSVILSPDEAHQIHAALKTATTPDEVRAAFSRFAEYRSAAIAESSHQ